MTVAKYLYDPFGNALAAIGPLAEANLYRFSSKESHAKSGLAYFLYRFYRPDLQRWMNRDPLSGGRIGPENTAMLENGFSPFEFHNGGNIYHFVQNAPIANVDAFGLDLWIIKDKCGKWGHVWVVGSNSDGTYWESDKDRSNDRWNPVNCPADISFRPTSNKDPNNLDNCLEVVLHVKTTPAVDKSNRDEAERRSNNRERFDAFSCNCRHYAQEFYWRTKWKERGATFVK